MLGNTIDFRYIQIYMNRRKWGLLVVEMENLLLKIELIQSISLSLCYLIQVLRTNIYLRESAEYY